MARSRAGRAGPAIPSKNSPDRTSGAATRAKVPKGVFVPEARHMNGISVSGGAFADAVVGALTYFASIDQVAISVTLNSEFVGAGALGVPVYGTGRVVRDYEQFPTDGVSGGHSRAYRRGERRRGSCVHGDTGRRWLHHHGT